MLSASSEQIGYRVRQEAVEKPAYHRQRAALSTGDKELSDYPVAKAAECESAARR